MEEFTLTRKGCVPYKITEEQYKIFVAMISDERRKRLEDAIREAYDFFSKDEFIEIITEELQDLGFYLE
jgi:hypothetical protein